MDVLAVLREAQDVIKETLKKGEYIKIHKFGAFHPMRQNETIYRNPNTNEPVHLPARIGIKFKPHRAFKDYVNGRTGDSAEDNEDDYETDD